MYKPFASFSLPSATVNVTGIHTNSFPVASWITKPSAIVVVPFIPSTILKPFGTTAVYSPLVYVAFAFNNPFSSFAVSS